MTTIKATLASKATTTKSAGHTRGIGWELWGSERGVKVALTAILPPGCKLVQGENSVTVRYDARLIPELLAADGSVWQRLGGGDNVTMMLKDFADAEIV
jgi:hypothetical protein